MKNWTVTFRTPSPSVGYGLNEVNIYVTSEAPVFAIQEAEIKLNEIGFDADTAEVTAVEECAVSPALANAIEGFLVEEYEQSADNVQDTFKPIQNGCRIPILYTTLDLMDNDDNYLAEDIEIQIYINYLTGAFEVWTNYNEDIAYIDGYYNDDELAEIMDGATFQGFYDEYAPYVRQWWIDHPDRFKEVYGKEIPEETEA